MHNFVQNRPEIPRPLNIREAVSASFYLLRNLPSPLAVTSHLVAWSLTDRQGSRRRLPTATPQPRAGTVTAQCKGKDGGGGNLHRQLPDGRASLRLTK